MMPARLRTLNVLLVVLGVVLAADIVWELTRPAPPARARPEPPGPPAAAPMAPGPAVRRESPAAWSVIAARNLFSPTRSEGPVTPGAGGLAQQLPKPTLYGVVLREGARVAYLEDPVTKRVAAYRVGDVVAGATVQSIAADRVVLKRPEGNLDVRLHDPTKPRPALPPPGAPAAPGAPGAPVPPGVMPPLPPGTVLPPQPSLAPPPSSEAGAAPPQIRPPVRRPLPPNLYRRVPPGFPQRQPGDATTQ